MLVLLRRHRLANYHRQIINLKPRLVHAHRSRRNASGPTPNGRWYVHARTGSFVGGPSPARSVSVDLTLAGRGDCFGRCPSCQSGADLFASKSVSATLVDYRTTVLFT